MGWGWDFFDGEYDEIRWIIVIIIVIVLIFYGLNE